jgi:hypothetical protein
MGMEGWSLEMCMQVLQLDGSDHEKARAVCCCG